MYVVDMLTMYCIYTVHVHEYNYHNCAYTSRLVYIQKHTLHSSNAYSTLFTCTCIRTCGTTLHKKPVNYMYMYLYILNSTVYGKKSISMIAL